MRICFIDYVLDPAKPGRSGLSDIVWDMATALIDEGHTVDVVASYHTNRYPDGRVQVHNFSTPPIGYRNLVGHAWILKRAADIVRWINPDIVHAPEYVSTAVLSVLGVSAPIVLTVPGNIFNRIATKSNTYDWYFTQVLKWAAKVSVRRCARIIVISQYMKYWWQRTGSPPERTTLIPLGVDPLRFRPIRDARHQLGLGVQDLVLLFVGRLSSEKGLTDLLFAYGDVVDKNAPTGLRLELIGDGPQRSELELLVMKLGLARAVTFRGWVSPDDLPTWYSAADALVLPSHAEAFARVIPEAMVCGTPVIGSHIGGAQDHIQDGVNGFLFPAGDVEALASVLRRIMADPSILRQMRVPTLCYATENLLWPKVIQRIVNEVYLPILGDSLRGGGP